MKKKKNVRFAKPIEYERVRNFFLSIDDSFFPALSKREGNVDRYLTQPFEEGRVVLYERDGEICGAFTYNKEGNDIFLQLAGVDKRNRKSPAFYRMFEHFIQNDSLDPSGKIRTFTWSTNKDSKAVLKNLGFVKTGEIKGDLDNERTTETYEGRLSDMIERFGQKNQGVSK